VAATMPWLLEMEDRTCFIGDELVEAIISPARGKLAACSEGRTGMLQKRHLIVHWALLFQA